ncbi:ankyrin repeat-containing domain protein [Fusarium oxysporum]|nr:ankyrin repeat-containing domain protein [Fusarium oxysporum]
MTSPLSETESPYQRYRRDPTEVDANGDQENWQPSPLSIIDRDGSVLFERTELDLRTDIICQNDVEMLQQYLNAAPWAIEKPGPKDSTTDPFFVAAQSGRVEALQALLAHYSKVNGPSEEVRFPDRRVDLLSTAAKWGRVEVVRFLLDNQPLYADIQERGNNGESAILSAADTRGTRTIDYLGHQEVCLDNNEAVMHLLLDRGACASDSLTRYDDRREAQASETVLTLAVQWAGPGLIQRLIDSGAEVHAKIGYKVGFIPRLEFKDLSVDVTAISVASLHANFKAVEVLISNRGNGVDITDMTSHRDSQGRLPVHWASQCQLTHSPSAIPASRIPENAESVMNTIKLLLNNDPKTINIQDNGGNTPWHYAALFYGRLGKQHTPIMRFLCDRGADASICNVYEETPLHMLFHRGWGYSPVDTMAVETLLAHGAKATDVDVYGNTPLHYAAWFLRHSDAVSYLLKHGADVNIRNLCQETPLHSVADSPYWGDTAHDGRTPTKKETAEELFKDQEAMMAELMEAGGVEMMDQPNHAGKSPRHITQEWKEHAREAQAKQTAIDNDVPWFDWPTVTSSWDSSGRGRRKDGTGIGGGMGVGMGRGAQRRKDLY